MPLPDLVPDHLVVLAFGPGRGELILVRVPPDAWMVVDGCGAGKTVYALTVLTHYRAHPRVVLLTHPHDDHSRGIAEVIEAATPPDREETWPRIGMVLPPADDVVARSAGFIARVTLQAIAAVTSRWSASPACRWDVNIGDIELLGDAHDEQSGRAEERSLAELEVHDEIIFNPRTAGFPDCYVLVSIPPDGGPPSVEQGPGSIRVVPPSTGFAQKTLREQLLDDPFEP